MRLNRTLLYSLAGDSAEIIGKNEAEEEPQRVLDSVRLCCIQLGLFDYLASYLHRDLPEYSYSSPPRAFAEEQSFLYSTFTVSLSISHPHSLSSSASPKMQPSLALHVTLASPMPAIVAQLPFAIPVEVSIYNPAEHPVTFLKWGTPMDPRAGVLGVFTVCDTGSGETLAMETIKISRKLPASHDDLIEVSAGQTLEKAVYLPGLSLQKGHEYSVRAEGIWHAIWEKPLADVTTGHLEDLAEAKRGEFQSNSALFKVQ